jgi:hypothetical protein
LRDPVSRAYSEWQMRHFSQKKEDASQVTLEVFKEEMERDMKRVTESITTIIDKEKGPVEGGGEDVVKDIELDWVNYLRECSDVDQPTGINQFQPLVGRGLYYHQLKNWMKYFPASQVHVVSSDEMRADPAHILNGVCRFLGIDDTFYHPDQSFLQEQKNVGGTTFKSSTQQVHGDSPPCAPPPGAKKESIPTELEEKLYAFFEPHNQLLYRLVGQNMKWAPKEQK